VTRTFLSSLEGEKEREYYSKAPYKKKGRRELSMSLLPERPNKYPFLEGEGGRGKRRNGRIKTY